MAKKVIRNGEAGLGRSPSGKKKDPWDLTNGILYSWGERRSPDVECGDFSIVVGKAAEGEVAVGFNSGKERKRRRGASRSWLPGVKKGGS